MNDESSIRSIRIEKLSRLRELGFDPFAIEEFPSDGTASDLLARFPEEGDFPDDARPKTRFAGRLVSYRLMGKAGFAHLSDGDAKIQAYFKKDDLGEGAWEAFELLDIGDHVGVEGELFITRTGERSIHVRSFSPLTKALQVLPFGKEKEGERWYGLHDTETRYRHRHLDLVCNPDARRILVERSKIVSAVRRYFDSQGYLEVETPLLQIVAGGAAARPFKTFYDAYDMEVKLRISLELYLKRLICGDLPRVYEIGRVFRNEGISNRHNPEFTLLEFYEAYTNLEGMMRRMEELFAFVAQEVYGTTTVVLHGGRGDGGDFVFDFARPWKRVDLLDEICRHTGLDREELSDLDIAKTAIVSKGVLDKAHALGGHISLEKETSLGGLIEKLLEVFVEPTLQEPTFVVGYPIETSPLAKKDPSNPKMTRRFEGYILGREICNAFSEINDPVDQRERFEQQARELAKGDEEAHPFDEEFLFALECGMPPTGGCGMGMERLAMIFTGADHIREVMLFPTMRPESGDSHDTSPSPCKGEGV